MMEDAGAARDLGLERVQRWMQAVITHSEGVVAGVASGEARLSIGVELPSVESIVAPSATLSGAERLAVYSHAYHARLLQCFRETFPALLFALGEELFDRFALDYLKSHPPRSYTLDNLADAFAQHLTETRPDAAAPPGEREGWVDFIIELASLEHAFAKVYDGPGLEGRPLPRAEEILAHGDERFMEARPAPAPCLRLFAFSHPVHTYMLAARGGTKPELPGPAETFVAMTRRDYSVVMYELNAPRYSFLQALDGRRSIGEALDAAAPLVVRGTRVRAASGWIREWAGRGFFENV
jgi:hypothetical protein